MLSPLAAWGYSGYAQYQMERRFDLDNPVVAALQVPSATSPPAASSGGGEAAGPGAEEGPPARPAPLDDEPGELTPLVLDHQAPFPAMRIEIPKARVKAVVVGDIRVRDLRKGPGHYPDTPYPGEAGNAAIAGHRTTYGAWFRQLDKLVPGDPVYVAYPDVTVTYEVERVFIIEPTDWSVVAPTPYPALTLTTCHPLYSAEQRLVVRAKLVGISHGAPDNPTGPG